MRFAAGLSAAEILSRTQGERCSGCYFYGLFVRRGCRCTRPSDYATVLREWLAMAGTRPLDLGLDCCLACLFALSWGYARWLCGGRAYDPRLARTHSGVCGRSWLHRVSGLMPWPLFLPLSLSWCLGLAMRGRGKTRKPCSPVERSAPWSSLSEWGCWSWLLSATFVLRPEGPGDRVLVVALGTSNRSGGGCRVAGAWRLWASASSF